MEQPIALLLLLGAIGLALQSGRTPAQRTPARIAATAPVRGEQRAEIPIPVPPSRASRSVPSASETAPPTRLALAGSARTTASHSNLPHVRSEDSFVRNPPQETASRSRPAAIFSTERTPLLEGERIAAARADLGDLVKEVNAKTALEAVRKSFVDGLANDAALSSDRGSGPPAAAALSFARVSTTGRSGPARRDPRVEAFWADVSARSLASETADDLESRLLPSKPADPSPRVSVLRRIAAPGFAASAYCRQGELACSVARISPARSARRAPAD
jgi:hypothetical protein